jgi:hypothetical protein
MILSKFVRIWSKILQDHGGRLDGQAGVAAQGQARPDYLTESLDRIGPARRGNPACRLAGVSARLPRQPSS